MPAVLILGWFGKFSRKFTEPLAPASASSVRIEVAGGDLSERRQGFFGEGLFSFVGRVGIIVEQMIVAVDAVIDGVGGVKRKIFPKIVGAKLSKLGHVGPISSYARCCNFL